MGNSEILKYSKCLHNIKDIKNILTIQSKVLSHFTEKSVVRKHIKSDNQTDNEGEKSFLVHCTDSDARFFINLDKLNECMRVRSLTSAMFVARTLFKIPAWTPISKLRMKIRNQVHHLFSEELHYNVTQAT